MAGPLDSLFSLTHRPCASAARWLGLAAGTAEGDADASSSSNDDAVLDAVAARLDAAYERATALTQLSRALAPIEAVAVVEEEHEAAPADDEDTPTPSPLPWSPAWFVDDAHLGLTAFVGLCVVSAAAWLATWGAAKKAVACSTAARSPAGALTAPLLATEGVIIVADHAERGGQYVRITLA